MKSLIKIIGLITVIGYMTVILFIWMYTNYAGYTYFQAGEPLSYIKYPEWFLGIAGIFVSINILHEEIKSIR